MNESHDIVSSPIFLAVQEAWTDGYDTAVGTLRELGKATDDTELQEIIGALAETLEKVRP